ncbi:MAG: TetR/AcrR family transcriptional regulator [Spirochaetaceae bacterium]|jgi:AcrR family transcriptional regulator|nr:TetR/AcrR family transcriptional regulator [Spirochaetaceae bacterium]
MDTDFFSFSKQIDRISQNFPHLVTPTFLKLQAEKKAQVILGILQEAAQRGDPTTLNIKLVAQKASISVGALYKYFTKRENMMVFTIGVIRQYLVNTMEYSTDLLKQLPLRDALYYFCVGSQQWNEEEKTLGYFFYQAAYGTNTFLSEELVKPAAQAIYRTLEEILQEASSRDNITLLFDLNFCTSLLYRSLVPLADCLIYPQLKYYLNPQWEDPLPIYETIDILLKSIIKENKP